MIKNNQLKRIVSALMVLLLTAALVVPTTLTAGAKNKRFITELCAAAGEEAAAALEEDGWSVTMVGLNATSDSASQVYLAYKMNTGSPITDVILSPDVGDSFSVGSGITYHCVSHVDVDEGIGGGAGCLYVTYDTRVGEPLVGLDVLRGNREEGDVLYPITNDGAEIVRTPDGAPADLEASSDTNVVYLAQIRDGIVRPYISEIGIVTDTDKWNAVYTAAERGFNYYVEGDIDGSTDTYTIIGYDRTADPAEAITNITAVTAQTVMDLEEAQIIDELVVESENVTAAAVAISGAEYVRTSSQPISAEEPYYIYRTKDTSAGNPISMIYAEKAEEQQNFLLGTWANDYFFSPGVTSAYTYSMNEDIYLTLWEDQTVCTKLPVHLLDEFAQGSAVGENDESEAPATADEAAADENTEADNDTNTEEKSKFINLTVVTPRDGLPDSLTRLTGLRGDPSAPYVERTGRGDRVNKYQASVFSSGGGIALIAGSVVIIAAAAVLIVKKRLPKKQPAKAKKPR